MGQILCSSAVVTIGFNTAAYTVLEDAGSVNVTVSVLNGTLARNVAVTLSTESGGMATGEFNILQPNENPHNIYLFYHYSWDSCHPDL